MTIFATTTRTRGGGGGGEGEAGRERGCRVGGECGE